jgi:large subunit ribosomal protein L14e
LAERRVKPQLGQIVEITRGNEAGNFAVIVGIPDPRTLLLADGAKRPGDAPKRKNILHVKLLPYVDPDVAQEAERTGWVANARLRYCLNRFEKTHVRMSREAEKGSESRGER